MKTTLFFFCQPTSRKENWGRNETLSSVIGTHLPMLFQKLGMLIAWESYLSIGPVAYTLGNTYIPLLAKMVSELTVAVHKKMYIILGIWHLALVTQSLSISLQRELAEQRLMVKKLVEALLLAMVEVRGIDTLYNRGLQTPALRPNLLSFGNPSPKWMELTVLQGSLLFILRFSPKLCTWQSRLSGNLNTEHAGMRKLLPCMMFGWVR